MFQLSNLQKQSLLDLARRAVESRLLDRPLMVSVASDARFPEEKCGVFVSIHLRGELRGCIGRIESAEPLPRTTADCAVSAAFADPRFVPLGLDELHDVAFEISVLSPPEPVADVETIEVGRHGILIERGAQRGLLLPQVATAQGWDRDEFLRQTSIKAGLGPEAWKAGAALSVFEAVVFQEE